MQIRPYDIKQARLNANMTQKEAAEVLGYKLRAWQHWEYGTVPMRPKLFEIFKKLTEKKHG